MRQHPRALRASIPVILHLARQDLIDRHSGSLLGATWTFIGPLVNILVFVLVFSRIMGAKLEASAPRSTSTPTVSISSAGYWPGPPSPIALPASPICFGIRATWSPR
ncbi:hypothetical protein [Halomonas sp. PR-M31]|uniref:hypothetical protein n=1 Tax=Halomonas sp. PR-M31 TaxID=1471202 RepID=UPI0020A0D139|nr:hypothetical protein [Halomonas sp. PR-M31]